MSARAVHQPSRAPRRRLDGAVTKIIRRLEQDNKDGTLFGCKRSGFTRAQLAAAVSMLRERAPSIEILRLSPWYRQTLEDEETWLSFECSRDEAAALVGHKCLPKPPRRVKKSRHVKDSGKPWNRISVRCKALGRVSISMDITPEDAARAPAEPLAAFSAAAIRALAPLSRLRGRAPETREAWKAELLKDVLFVLDSMAPPRMIEIKLCEPSMFKMRRAIAPRQPTQEDRKIVDSLIEAANIRFQLRESSRQHILAVYTRLHGELRQALVQAIEAAPVEDLEAARGSGGLRLVIDNTRSRQP